jgi:hypothetical protein
MLKELSTVVALSALVGCVDARKSFDQFGDHVVDANTSMPDNPIVSMIPDATGHFLFSAHIAAAPNAAPIEVISDFTVTSNGNGSGKVSYMGYALTTADLQIATDPPGPHFQAADQIIAPDATFTAALTGTLPGDANPITPGLQVSVNGVLHATIKSTDLICGTITGTAIVDLSGSTFGIIRVAPGTIGAALPPPVVACPP